MADSFENNFHKITAALTQKTPFVSYQKPNENKISLLIQQNDTIHYLNNYTENGFIFAPFNNQSETIIFSFKQCDFIEFDNRNLKFETINYRENDVLENSSIKKNNHINLVQKGISFIKKNETVSKIVLSRKECLESHNFNILNTFKNLLTKYKSAFVYLWYHPKIGLWMGATPETLIELRNNNFKTMALAGTQKYVNTLNVDWPKKEVNEQKLVTDFISKNLTDLAISHKISAPFSKKAGNLIHICTEITARLADITILEKLISKLHPTPAVCGTPKEIAKQFILKEEAYNREYYTGFLGELNIETDQRKKQKNKRNIENQAYQFHKKQTHLFVNLRCMKIEENSISLYVGGGITKDSNSEQEYFETVAKANILKSII